jgi:hypothetical protein
MTTSIISPAAQEMVRELLILLDEEIQLLQLRVSQFEEMYDCTLHRRSQRLVSLTEEMVLAQQRQVDLDTQLQTGRALIARSLGMPRRDLKLSTLIAMLENIQASQLDHKRQQIILLAEQLKRRHLDAAMLLNESIRINHVLLEGLLPASGTVTTYNTDGAKGWRDGTGLLDAEI